MNTPPDPDMHPATLASSAALVAGVGLAAAFGDFLAYTIPVPVGFLLLVFALVILPTGDLLRLAAEYIDRLRPEEEDDTISRRR